MLARRLTILLVGLLLGACGSLDHSNPYDPSTPPEQQARATLSGTVSLEGSGGTAPSLAGVHVSIPGSSLAADTDATGAYAIAAVPPGTYALQAVATGYETGVLSGVAVSLDDGNHTVTVPLLSLKLARGGVQGVISSATFGGLGAAPLPGASVSLDGLPGAATTDDAGGFLLAGVPAGTYTLHVSRTGFVSPPGVQVSVGGAALTDAGTVAVDWDPGGAAGTVLVQGAAASGGVTVRVKGLTLVGTPFEATTTSAPDGSWGLQGLVPAGSYTVSFELASYAVVAATTTVSPHATSSVPAVTLARDTGDLTGLATLEGSGDSSGVLVTLTEQATTNVAGAALTDSTGAWRVDAVPVGIYDLAFSRTGYAAQTAQATVVSHQVTSAPARVLAAVPGVLRGRCLLEGLVAPGLAGTTVRLVGSNLSTVTLSDGSFILTGVGAGAQVVAFEKSGHDSQQVQVVSSPGGDLTLLDVTLAASRGVITGHVALSPGALSGFSVGADLSGAVVTLTGTDEPVPAAVTDAAGNFRFTQVRVSSLGTPFTVTARRPSYLSASAPVTASPSATVDVGSTLTLVVNAGTLSGTAQLWDNVNDAGANSTSAGVTIQVSGSAFNQTSFVVSQSPTSAANGAWSVTVPPGSYGLVATSADRTCAALPSVTVSEGAAVTVTTLARCVDAIAPGAVVLGAPTPPAAAQAGYTSVASATVPVSAAATDTTSPTPNLRGYQLSAGAAPDWASATVTPVQALPQNLTFALPTSGGLPVDGSYTLWARAIDWAGNAGPAASVAIVVDSTPPPAPAISTARATVNDTSAAVTLSGAESAPNFLQYEACSGTPTGATCGTTPSCVSPASPATTPAGFSAQLTLNATNCVWARSRDKAGNASAWASAQIVSDLQPPTGPGVSPAFDPSALSVHADYADFFITSPATDLPVGGGSWANIAWIEVNAGSGFSPLCPQSACHPRDASGNPVYNPCACGCSDSRLLCRDGALYAIRVPLLGGTANNVAVRAVDVAGNVGSGAAQSVPVAGQDFQVAATSYDEGQPRVRGRILVYKGKPSGTGWTSRHLVDLGTNQLYDASDVTCEISNITPANTSSTGLPVAEPLSPTAVVYADAPYVSNTIKVRRAWTDGAFCTGDDVTSLVKTVSGGYPWVIILSASMDAAGTQERVAWFEANNGGGGSVKVRDGGADRLLGSPATPDDVEVTVATLAAGYYVTQLQLAGDVLVYGVNQNDMSTPAAHSGMTVVNAVGGSFASGTATTWALPTGTVLAALEEKGAALASYETATHSLHVRYPGADGRYGTADDVEGTPRAVGASPTNGGLAIRDAHVVLTEASGSGARHVDHWYAGADLTFGNADDTYARVLPSAAARYWPTLGTNLSGGVVFLQAGASGNSGDNADLLGVDLSALRWDVAGAGAPAQGPVTNKAGTLFYVDAGSTLRARTSDGRETSLNGVNAGGGVAADGANLFVGSGAALWLYRRDPSTLQFFTAGQPAPVQVATAAGPAYPEAAGGGRVIYDDGSTGTLTLLEPSPTIATPAPVSLEGAPAGYQSWFGGVGVSSVAAVFGCMGAAPSYHKHVCVRESADGIYGNGNDRTFVLYRAGTTTPFTSPVALAVSGQRIALVADAGSGAHLHVVDAGADGRFNTGDDVQVDYGALVDGRIGGLDLAGDLLVWSTDVGLGTGQQIVLADHGRGTRRTLTTHYSQKPRVVVDATGRAAWLDQIFPSSAIFVGAP